MPKEKTVLRRRRLELGLSLSAAAQRADTSPATWSRYEAGWTRFEVYTLKKLAAVLDCDLDIRLVPRKRPAEALTPAAAARRLARLFWDRKLKRGDLEQYPVWVVERVLEFGALDDVRALIAAMGRPTFLATVAQATRLSPKTQNFWRQMLKKEGRPCTRKSSRNTAWNC